LSVEEEGKIIEESIEWNVKHTSLELEDQRKKLEQSGKYTEAEASAISMNTSNWDGFKFCANFPGDLYGEEHKYMVEYYDAQSQSANEFKTKIANKIKDYYTRQEVWIKLTRIRKCAQELYNIDKAYGFNQSQIQSLYEKLYWETYYQYSETIFERYTDSETGIITLPSLEAYVDLHQQGK
jgi:hypothetical protein